MSQERNDTDQRKPWAKPVLEQLTVDLSAIRQKLSGKTDSHGVGAVS